MIRSRVGVAAVTFVLALAGAAVVAEPAGAYVTAPVVDAVSPNSGFIKGGNTLVLAGSGLMSVTGVLFGTTRSGAITHDGNGRLSVVVPAHAAGTVHVRVAGPHGNPNRDWQIATTTSRACRT